MQQCFYGCNALTSASLPKLTTVSGGNGIQYCFYGCTALTSVLLPELTTISGNSGMTNCFQGCKALTSVSFPKLTTISGSNGMLYCFQGCKALTSVSFPALTTTSFGSSYTNQFNNMLFSTDTNVTHTIHFPSNLQTTISGLTGYPTFGGTSGYVTLAFDLPATS